MRSVFLFIWVCLFEIMAGNVLGFHVAYRFVSSDTIKLLTVYGDYSLHSVRYSYHELQSDVISSDKEYVLIKFPWMCTRYEVKYSVNLTSSGLWLYTQSLTLTTDIGSTLPIKIYHEKSDTNVIYVYLKTVTNYECVDGVKIIVDNNEQGWYKNGLNLANELSITNLSPCVLYNIIIVLMHQSKGSLIYNKHIRTQPKLGNVENIMYDKETDLLTWSQVFRQDCSSPFVIKIQQVNNEIERYGQVFKSMTNVYNMDSLPRCLPFQAFIQLDGDDGTMGTFKFETSYKEPSFVTNLTVVKVSWSEILISWRKPKENPACATDYVVHINGNPITTKLHEYSIVDLKCVIYNISVCVSKNCANYTYDAIATNLQNVSDISIVNSERRSFIVNWNISDGEQCVKYYATKLYDANMLEISRQNRTEPNITFKQLNRCEKYKLYIEKVPIYNWPYKIESILDFEINGPDAPSQPEISFPTTDALKLRSEYQKHNDKCTIEMFRFTCVSGNSSRTVYDESGEVFFRNLKNYANYRCSVMVKNKIGWSDRSTYSNSYVTYQINQLGLYIHSVSSRTIKIAWTIRQTERDIHLSITKMVEPHQLYPNCEYVSWNKTIELTNEPVAEYEFLDLEPYTNYSIHMEIYFLEKPIRKFESTIFVLTDPDVSHQVENLKISAHKSLTISWRLPCVLNGMVKGFVGTIIESDSLTLDVFYYNWTIPFKTSENFQQFQYSIDQIKPNHFYVVTVAIKLKNFMGALNESKITFDPRSELLGIEDHRIFDWGVIKNDGPNSAILEIDDKKFLLADESEFPQFILVFSQDQCEKKHSSSIDHTGMISASRYQLHDSNLACMIKCKFRRIPRTVEIRLIDDNISSNCSDASFIELKKGIEYEIVARLFVTESRFIDSTPIYLVPYEISMDQDISVVLFFLVLIPVVMGTVALILGLFYNRWRKIQKPSDSTYIEVNKFNEFYNSIDDEFIANEYQSIDDMDLSNLSRACSKNQSRKNRYTDITPYDFNRVLVTLNEYCDTDYINASHIDGYNNKNRYIATQGPTEDTAYDFWHMVVEQKCDRIVMLTQLSENGITKCYQYFPVECETCEFNDLTITGVEETNCGNFIKRVLIISKGLARRIIFQYQFIAWPDRDCPEDELTVIEFLKFIRRENSKLDNPMVVHCSAGVGRTGTFIALDILLLSCRQEKFISICDTVRKLRLQRGRMVQTVGQYEFLYKSINMSLSQSIN